MNICSKCGREVPRDNDCARLEAMINSESIFGSSRHLLPVKEGDVVICEGSPSRAQYLSGQPRDQRAGYQYQPHLEDTYRAAYKSMQVVTKPSDET
jgi:hypothetical protein